MDCDRGTGPHGRGWTISGGGDILWKGKEERCLFGAGWKFCLSPWIGSWLAWDSVSGDNRMPWMYGWECVCGGGILASGFCRFCFVCM